MMPHYDIKVRLYSDIPVQFTGVAFLEVFQTFVHLKNGYFHNKTGPAKYSLLKNEWFFLLAGTYHRVGGPAIKYKVVNGEHGYE